jgi:hypothetical protein
MSAAEAPLPPPLAPGLEGVELAITCLQPWATITVEGPRAHHNLTARPPSTIIGKRVAIYAPPKPDTTTGGQAMELLEAAGIGPAVRVSWKTRTARGAIIGTALVVGIVAESDDVWFVGPFALVLGDRRPLETPVKLARDAVKAGGIWRLG